jgi:hypothetical protein
MAAKPSRHGEPYQGSKGLSESLGKSRCPGCHASFPIVIGPTHPYIGASPGCWAAYNEILAREFGEFGYPECHRLLVDAYAAQHPGTPSRQSIQSVCGHLVTLHLVLEKGLDARRATAALGKVVNRRPGFVWLEPPAAPAWLTILDVVGARDLEDHELRVREWAASVFKAWSRHHGLVRDWAQKAS